MKASFRNDYSDIADPAVLKALLDATEEKNIGYGYDAHSKHAEAMILDVFGIPDGAVYFLSGGTQVNMAVLSYLLRPYESVIAADTGHINVHETGAVEGSGHKILTAGNANGKLLGEDVIRIVSECNAEHSTRPGAVYIADATETGTVYTKQELLALREAADRCGLFLFMDGARIGSALMSSDTDVHAKDIGELSDVFYVGGTKNGALYGEAVVFRKKALGSEFLRHMKNRGALLAKGFVTAIQFEALFDGGRYFDLARKSNEKASFIASELRKANICTEWESRTNQLFYRVPNDVAEKLRNEYALETWENGETKSLMRVVTSFKTTEADCRLFIEDMKKWLTE